MERSAIRERAEHQHRPRISRSLSSGGASRRPVGSIRATSFLGEHANALSCHRVRRRRDPLAPRNDAQPVDKPVDSLWKTG
jgi:hypothetical protein